MKRDYDQPLLVLIAGLLVFMLCVGLCGAIVNIAFADSPDYTDDRSYANFAGRLYIPDVGIDLALYRSNKQYVVDRKDSAAYFNLKRWPRHMLIADHNTQGFSRLHEITVGTQALIIHKDDSETWYECVEVFPGHNTGKYITDNSYRNVVARQDLLMYTCYNGWKNVIVTLWAEKPPDEPSSNEEGDFE